MHQQGWQDLWNLFLALMAGEPIHVRVAIGMALVFLAVMSLTGMADSFLPRRAARRYAAMYDMMPAVAMQPAAVQSFEFVPQTVEEQPEAMMLPDPLPEEPADAAIGSETDEAQKKTAKRPFSRPLSFSTPRRSAPQPPKVFRTKS